ncbi:LmeA family phospholipid-binding protein [Nakamurella lactea]|uniref:LmeA family phospholipid-binding protein n=1 Tax=Nakamurella lactea TaxID=459515 RepID=UPI00048FF3B8|nr:DUF2993 domain-containing protein [Nakamurella lactea]
MRKLLITLIVLILLVIGADFAGRAIAESKAGEAIATEGGVSPAPDVDIHGMSFLWQAIAGNYQHITVASHDLSTGKLTGVDATVELYDVRLTISDVLDGNVDSLTSGHADITASIPAPVLASVLEQQELTVAAGDNGALRLGTTVAAAGQTFPVTIDVTPTYADGTLRLGNAKVVEAPAAVPTALTNALIKDFSIDLPLTGLPFRLDSATARVDGSALVLTGSARDVQLGQLLQAAG